jgi:hypothetical protein
MEAKGTQKEHYGSQYLSHYVCKDNGFSSKFIIFATKLRRL